jgi:hypothetical protein
MKSILELVIGPLESPRLRDLERRFIQRYGWGAYQVTDANGGKVWLWSHPRYSRSYYRGQAFMKELARQTR